MATRRCSRCWWLLQCNVQVAEVSCLQICKEEYLVKVPGSKRGQKQAAGVVLDRGRLVLDGLTAGVPRAEPKQWEAVGDARGRGRKCKASSAGCVHAQCVWPIGLSKDISCLVHGSKRDPKGGLKRNNRKKRKTNTITDTERGGIRHNEALYRQEAMCV